MVGVVVCDVVVGVVVGVGVVGDGGVVVGGYTTLFRSIRGKHI